MRRLRKYAMKISEGKLTPSEDVSNMIDQFVEDMTEFWLDDQPSDIDYEEWYDQIAVAQGILGKKMKMLVASIDSKLRNNEY